MFFSEPYSGRLDWPQVSAVAVETPRRLYYGVWIAMPWFSKESPTALDNVEIPGLEFLDGDAPARRYQQQWLEGKKYPMIAFPSGIKREIHSTIARENGVDHLLTELKSAITAVEIKLLPTR
jgi:hypothetical protein